MKPFSLDVVRYLAGFRVSGPQGVLMATQLVKRCPKNAPEPVRQAADKVRRTSARVHAEWKKRGTDMRADARPAIITLGNVWNAVHSRVVAWTKLPDGSVLEVTEAATVVDAVFAEGLSFMGGDHAERWLSSGHKLDQLTKALPAERLHALVGSAFVTALQTAHRDAGVALGMAGDVAQRPRKRDLRALLQELVQSVNAYALQVCAHADLSKSTEAERVAWMLDPIEKQRARGAVAASEDSNEDDDHATRGAEGGGEIGKTPPANDGGAPKAERHVA